MAVSATVSDWDVQIELLELVKGLGSDTNEGATTQATRMRLQPWGGGQGLGWV